MCLPQGSTLQISPLECFRFLYFALWFLIFQLLVLLRSVIKLSVQVGVVPPLKWATERHSPHCLCSLDSQSQDFVHSLLLLCLSCPFLKTVDHYLFLIKKKNPKTKQTSNCYTSFHPYPVRVPVAEHGKMARILLKFILALWPSVSSEILRHEEIILYADNPDYCRSPYTDCLHKKNDLIENYNASLLEEESFQNLTWVWISAVSLTRLKCWLNDLIEIGLHLFCLKSVFLIFLFKLFLMLICF